MTFASQHPQQTFNVPQIKAHFSELEFENQHFQLQQALNELNYHGCLGKESVPLVHAVFSDLVDITRNYQQVKSLLEKSQQQAEVTQNQIQPLRKENERLTKTNNNLRLQLLRAQGKHEESLRVHAIEIQKLQNSVADAKFLLSQKVNKTKAQEFDLIQLKRKFDAFLQQNGGFAEKESACAVRFQKFPKQSLDMKSVLDALQKKFDSQEQSCRSQAAVDTLLLAEKRAAEMSKQLETMKNNESNWEGQVSVLRKAIVEHSSKSTGIHEVQNELELFADAECFGQRRVVKQLKHQVDHLNMEIVTLQEALNKKCEMEVMLREQCKQLSEEHNQAAGNGRSVAENFIGSSEKGLRQQNDDFERQLTELGQLSSVRNRELVVSLKEIDVLQKEREDLQEELHNQQRECQILCDEKLKFQKTEQILRAEAHEFSLQIEKLKRTVSVERQNTQEKASQVCELKTLCEQLDHSRERAEMRLQEIVSETQHAQSAHSQIQKNRDEMILELKLKNGKIEELRNAVQQLALQRDKMQILVNEKSERISLLSDENITQQTQKTETESKINKYKHQIESQAAELNDKIHEVGSLRQRLDELCSLRGHIQQEMRLKDEQCKGLSEDLANMTKENQVVNESLATTASERDEKSQKLECVLSKLNFMEEKLLSKEKEFADLMSNYRLLSQENDRSKILAQEHEQGHLKVCEEVRILRAQLERRDVHLNGLTAENKKFVADLSSLEQQNTELSRSVATLQCQMDAVNTEKERVSQDLSESKAVSTNLRKGGEGLEMKISELQGLNRIFRSQLDDSLSECEVHKLEVTEMTGRLRELQELVAGMRTKEKQNEIECSQAQLFCEHLKAQFNESDARNKQLEEAIHILQQQRELQHKEISQLTHALASGGLSRDEFVQEFQKKVEHLQQVVQSQVCQIRLMEEQRARMKEFLIKYETEIIRKERKINALKSIC